MRLGILLAGDPTIGRQDLKALLEREGFAVIGEASAAHDALRLTRQLHPDVVVLDADVPSWTAIDAARKMLRGSPMTRMIFLISHSDDRYILEAFRVGVRGFVLKPQTATDVVAAVREVSSSLIYLSPGISRAVVEAYLAKPEVGPDPLSRRERQVLRLIAAGKKTKEIAALLGISVKTAESHRTRLMRKLGIHETAGLVRYAIRRGLIQP